MTSNLYRELAIGSVILLLAAGCNFKITPTPPVPMRPALAPTPAPPPLPAQDRPDPIGFAETATTQPAPEENSTPFESEPTTTSQPKAESPRVLYGDAFTDVLGAIHWNKNGAKSAEGS